MKHPKSKFFCIGQNTLKHVKVKNKNNEICFKSLWLTFTIIISSLWPPKNINLFRNAFCGSPRLKGGVCVVWTLPPRPGVFSPPPRGPEVWDLGEVGRVAECAGVLGRCLSASELEFFFPPVLCAREDRILGTVFLADFSKKRPEKGGFFWAGVFSSQGEGVPIPVRPFRGGGVPDSSNNPAINQSMLSQAVDLRLRPRLELQRCSNWKCPHSTSPWPWPPYAQPGHSRIVCLWKHSACSCCLRFAVGKRFSSALFCTPRPGLCKGSGMVRFSSTAERASHFATKSSGSGQVGPPHPPGFGYSGWLTRKRDPLLWSKLFFQIQ